MLQHCAHFGNLFGQQHGKAAQRVYVVVYGQTGIDPFGDLLQLNAGIRFPQAIIDGAQQHLGGVVVLVLYFAENLLDQIFEGDDAIGAGIFVDHNRQMHPAAAHICQHIEGGAGLRHKQGLAHQAGPVFGRRGIAGQPRENILHQHQANHLVQRFAIDGQARMAVFGKGSHHLQPRGIFGQGDDTAARNGDIIGALFAKMQQVAQHLPLDR